MRGEHGTRESSTTKTSKGVRQAPYVAMGSLVCGYWHHRLWANLLLLPPGQQWLRRTRLLSLLRHTSKSCIVRAYPSYGKFAPR